MILAPLRGVTIRAFREVFADALAEAGFTEAITPFIPAMSGYDPLKDRELADAARRRVPVDAESLPRPVDAEALRVTPQFIGKDPAALRACLLKIKAAGYETADLNCGCPFPMVRNKGRGSGLLQHPEVLERMIAAGCEAMGPGKFSIKARLGVTRADELLNLMPLINRYPLRFLTIHGRIAKQMYEGEVDWLAVKEVCRVSQVPIVLNGDLRIVDAARRRVPVDAESLLHPVDAESLPRHIDTMIGRAFIRALGARDDIDALLSRYIEISQAELCGDRPVLGRMKELLSYWKDSPRWSRRWPVVKISRTLDEFQSAIGLKSRTTETLEPRRG